MTVMRIEYVMPSQPAAGESSAQRDLEQTFDRCGQAFCRFFSVRTGDDHATDDLMQQLWLQCRTRGGDVRQVNAEPWMWQVARNLLKLHWRSHADSTARRISVDPVLAHRLARQFDEEDIPSDVLARRETQDQLLLALTALSADEQALLIATYFEGRSGAELAKSLNVSARAVEGRLYRARAALRERLVHMVAD
jgi:RNA polymerase sigma-70 factor (ECF subfamily)